MRMLALARTLMHLRGVAMLKEFLMTVRALSQAGADLSRFYDQVDQIIKFEHDQAAIDKIYNIEASDKQKLDSALSL